MLRVTLFKCFCAAPFGLTYTYYCRWPTLNSICNIILTNVCLFLSGWISNIVWNFQGIYKNCAVHLQWFAIIQFCMIHHTHSSPYHAVDDALCNYQNLKKKEKLKLEKCNLVFAHTHRLNLWYFIWMLTESAFVNVLKNPSIEMFPIYIHNFHC